MNRVPNLVLIGFMGTGKSSVGRKCAAVLGFPYHDSDQWVVRRAGKSIPQIFEEDGESTFRFLESDAIRRLTGRSAVVLSTGGGAVLDPENCVMLRESGIVVLLTARVDTILERVGRRASRPLLSGQDPEARIRELLAQREPAYRAAAHAVVDTSDLSRDAAAQEVIAIYRSMAG